MRIQTLLIASLLTIAGSALHAADHFDAPALDGMGQADVADLYAFQSPNDPANSVLIMTVNPFAGVVSPTDFATDVDYEIQIDNNGDAMADVTYKATFAGAGSAQTMALTRSGAALGSGLVGQAIALTSGTAQAGVFDDPFFFDLAGFNDGFNFTGDDTLAGGNISAIVLEIPSNLLHATGSTNVGISARTVQNGSQIDRIGRPAINTALIPSARKDEFNLADPANDFTAFGDDVKATITALSDAANADALAPILLPDVLTFDTADATGFLNGRQLADDVIDAELNLLSAGGVTGDGVDMNDVAFSTSFPYLGEAHVVPEPASGLLALAGMVATLLGFRRRRQS